MIIFFVGGIGSGKTISMIKDIVDRKQRAYTNFKMYNTPSYKRLEVRDLVKITKARKKAKLNYKVNFKFWNQQLKRKEPFDIYIDELHNIANSRTGSRRLNIAMNLWIAQVRKILQGNEDNNICITTQRPMSIDVGWRDLTHFWVVCKKITLPVDTKTELCNGHKLNLPVSVVQRRWFSTLKDCMDYMMLGIDRSVKKDKFLANNYYKYYNTFDIITFGDKYL